jgi:hypothetical protein
MRHTRSVTSLDPAHKRIEDRRRSPVVRSVGVFKQIDAVFCCVTVRVILGPWCMRLDEHDAVCKTPFRFRASLNQLQLAAPVTMSLSLHCGSQPPPCALVPLPSLSSAFRPIRPHNFLPPPKQSAAITIVHNSQPTVQLHSRTARCRRSGHIIHLKVTRLTAVNGRLHPHSFKRENRSPQEKSQHLRRKVRNCNGHRQFYGPDHHPQGVLQTAQPCCCRRDPYALWKDVNACQGRSQPQGCSPQLLSARGAVRSSKPY